MATIVNYLLLPICFNKIYHLCFFCINILFPNLVFGNQNPHSFAKKDPNQKFQTVMEKLNVGAQGTINNSIWPKYALSQIFTLDPLMS